MDSCEPVLGVVSTFLFGAIELIKRNNYPDHIE